MRLLLSFLCESLDEAVCDDEKFFCNDVLPPTLLLDAFDELSDPDELDLDINVLLDDELPDFPLDDDVNDIVVPERALLKFRFCATCGFFDAGPLLTPGFNPVWVFGEFEPLLEPDDDE